MKQFNKILKFELNGYLKNKAFVGITVFLVVAIAVTMFIPNIIALFTSDKPTTPEERPVMLVYADNNNLLTLVASYFTEAFAEYDVQTAAYSVEQIQEKILQGEVECAFVMDSAASYTYYVNDLSMWDTNTTVANEVLQEVYRANAMIQGGLSAEQASQILSVTVQSTAVALGKDQAQNFLYTYVMIFALYMVILLYGQMVATNVATEKSSRAMELLVTSANPTSMMFGKVLASCLAGLSQLMLVFGSALLFYNINKANLSNPIIASIFDMPIELVVYLLVFFVLGFLIYAFLYGAIGSTASKLEDINTSVLPITFLFLISFFIVIFSMASGNVDSVLMKICSYIPFTSPMAMFTRLCMSTVAWYKIACSVVVLIASTVGIGIASAKIYRAGVLLYGTQPKLGTIIKMVFTKQ